MVLADDNFASIVAAVREGRTVYDNLMKVIRWTLPTNGGEAMTILAALAFGLALPITPVQILWINMVTAVTLGLTLAFEPTEPGTMRRPPRPAHIPVLDGLLLWRIVFVSALFVTGAFGMFFWAEARGQAAGRPGRHRHRRRPAADRGGREMGGTASAARRREQGRKRRLNVNCATTGPVSSHAIGRQAWRRPETATGQQDARAVSPLYSARAGQSAAPWSGR